MGIFSNKCKFRKHCTGYRNNSVTCNEEGGDYGIDPFEFRPVGCYRDLDKHGKLSKFWVDKHEKITNP